MADPFASRIDLAALTRSTCVSPPVRVPIDNIPGKVPPTNDNSTRHQTKPWKAPAAASGNEAVSAKTTDPPQTSVKQQSTKDDGSDDSDIDADVSHAIGPYSSDEIRRQQNEIFKSFAAAQAESSAKEVIEKVIKTTDDEQLSIQEILAKHNDKSKIVNARDYQTELFQQARDNNIIAVLDTGSGKTHIATMLLQHVVDQELEARAKGMEKRISFFLVDSVNLVYQQSSVLQCGLSQNVKGVSGACGCSLWSQKTWEKVFNEFMVIVCTAAVLQDCLMHAFIKISDINVLIFDEAHHAKRDHPYSKIIKDYYLAESDPSRRPKIFGMTASPIDAKVDVREAATELETLLHSRIATTSNLALMRNNISRPEEFVALYDRLARPFETPLHQKLKAEFGEIRAFSRLFKGSLEASSELGRWASDMYWSFTFQEEEARKMEMREQRLFMIQHKGSRVEQLDAEIARLREAAQMVQDHDFGCPAPNLADVSSKVLKLLEWLQIYFAEPCEHRCIVFVETRATARLLKLIYSHIGGPHLRAGILIGNNTRSSEINISLRQQLLTIQDFKKGKVNCLFATSVAEEGLDIPGCNLVVRFDLYRTMIQYVQSRGRARHRNSRYLHMLEKDNAIHSEALSHVRKAEKHMREFCEALPSDRLLDHEINELIADEQEYPQFLDKNSGAKLTYSSCLAIIAHFASCLPQDDENTTTEPQYVVSVENGQFICEVILPECSPIERAIGKPWPRKSLARRSAAYELCRQLRINRFLDQRFLPTIQKRLPELRNAVLAVSKKKNLYPMLIKPKFWSKDRGVMPERLYLTILDVDNHLDRPYEPLALLTRGALPSLPPFPLYLNSGKVTQVIIRSFSEPFHVGSEDVDMLTTVTLRVFLDIYNKTYEHEPSKMPYYLAPLRHYNTSEKLDPKELRSLIDWDIVTQIAGREEYRWDPTMPEEFLASRYYVDRFDGGRRFFGRCLRRDLKPTDPLPPSSQTGKKGKTAVDILDYTVSLWTKSKQKTRDRWTMDQPVIEAERVPFRRNLLAEPEQKEVDLRMPSCYIVPEPLKISTLPAPFVAMCYVFPAISYRVDSYLIALEANNLLGLDIGPQLALEALTKDSDNTDDSLNEKINLQRGMGSNYERLEFMGDCFLKMATSLSVFIQNPNDNEYFFHCKRMAMLCNKNLLRAALELGLPQYVRSQAFSRRLWYPEGLKMTAGKGFKKVGEEVFKHRLSDKTVADICEAFIGAAFLQHDEPGNFQPEKWDSAVRAVTAVVRHEDHQMDSWSDYFKSYSLPKYQLAQANGMLLALADEIECSHGYRFKYPRLLWSAFIHPSMPFTWDRTPHYQRLEFLGDSLLDMVFVSHIYNKYPDKDPQWLTEHKMPMVSNKFLGALCIKLGFHRHLRHNDAVLKHQIYGYAAEVEEAHSHRTDVSWWMDLKDPPKCLADIVEAFVGAVFVDSSFDFTHVQRFFDAHIKHFFEDMTIYDAFANSHPTTRLSKLLGEDFGCAHYRIATRTNPPSLVPGGRTTVIAMVMVHLQIIAHGTAVSGRYARIKASNNALELLDGVTAPDFRRRYGCDCRVESNADVIEENLRAKLEAE